MSVVHYVDIDEGHVVCAEARERGVPPERRWTFVAERVTCLECLRVIAEKREVTESLAVADDQ